MTNRNRDKIKEKKNWRNFQKSRGTYKKPTNKRLNLPKVTLADFTEGKKPQIVTKKSSREIYKTFLKTDCWKKVRKLVLERDKHTCQDCGSKRWLQVHHLTYKHHKDELNHLSDLLTLCKTCHKDEHKEKQFFTSY